MHSEYIEKTTEFVDGYFESEDEETKINAGDIVTEDEEIKRNAEDTNLEIEKNISNSYAESFMMFEN